MDALHTPTDAAAPAGTRQAGIHPGAIVAPNAVIAPGASIAAGCRIGPFCTIGPGAVLEEGVELVSHVVVEGATRLAAGVRVLPFAAIGTPPQDVKYRGEPTGCEVGRGTLVREGATIHRASVGGSGVTRVGAGCMIMAMAHVAHDCQLGEGVILANNVMLGGHVQVGEQVFIGGGAAIHQLVRIGRHAMVGGMAGVTNDIPPFGNVFGLPARLVGLNVIGLRRRGFSKENLAALRLAFRLLFREAGIFADKMEIARARYAEDALVQEVLGFIASPERKREMCRPGRMAADDEEEA